MHVALVGPDLEENLSIRYLSAALIDAGHTTTIVAFDTRADLGKALAAAAEADLVALSLCYQIRALEFIELAGALKSERPDRPIVIGGHYASCAAKPLLEEHLAFDVIVIHEGEGTIVELASLNTLEQAQLATVRGIAYRSTDGVVLTEPRPTVEDLDQLAWPDRSGPARLVVGVPTAYMMGSRGCVNLCDYCAITTLHQLAPGRRFRQRDPVQVAEEMAWLYHERGVRQFVFHDDNFLLPSVDRNMERIEALDRAIRQRGVRRIGIVLKCRPADVDEVVFRRLREMGLLRVFLGIESGTPEGLASLGRHQQTVAEAHRALDICDALEISTQYTVIIFHPEATPKTMRADLAFVRRHIAHPLSFCRAEAYAGTPLERRMIEAGRARGGYLGREYSYSDPTTELIWSAARSLLHDRCWSQDNLLGQSIRLDHLAAVFQHFYEGREVDALIADFRQWELEVNRDSVELLDDMIVACVEEAGSSALADRLAELQRRQQAANEPLQRRACELREALRACSYAKLGLSPAAAVPSRAARLFASIPRHAAAAVLAIGISCSSADGKDDSGVIEAPPPPIDMRVDQAPDVSEDWGVIEAPPPPIDMSVDQAPDVSEDWGVIEAPPPPIEAGTDAGNDGDT